MKDHSSILVVTDALADAELVAKPLRDEFENLFVSTDPKRAVEDFENYQPAVLILAFNSLRKAEHYYLGLYRLSTKIHQVPHRTVILCDQQDLQRVTELCKSEYFEDYILFWPPTHDTPRLAMTVHRLLRQLAVQAGNVPSTREFAALARHIADLESTVEKYAAKGDRCVESATSTLNQVEQNIGVAMDNFSLSLTTGALRGLVEVKDRPGFQCEIDRLKVDEIGAGFQTVTAAVQPVRQWAGALTDELADHLSAARDLHTLAKQVTPVVLVVDDDEFQRKLLGGVLQGSRAKILFASSGTEALAMMGKIQPDLVLMDVDLPDVDGIETTRRLRSIPPFVGIPVIMITGHSEKNVVVESLKAGASDFLVKPFDRDALLTKVCRFLYGAEGMNGAAALMT